MLFVIIITAGLALELAIGKTMSGHLIAAGIWIVAMVINLSLTRRKPKPLSREERKAFEARAFQTDFREINNIAYLAGVDIGINFVESLTLTPFKKLAARLYTRRFFHRNPEAKKNIVLMVIVMPNKVTHIRGGANVNAMKLADGTTLKHRMALLSKTANRTAHHDVAAFGSVFTTLCRDIEDAHNVKTGVRTNVISDMIQQRIAALVGSKGATALVDEDSMPGEAGSLREDIEGSE